MFDLDGTLVDTMAALSNLAAAIMHRAFGDHVAWARARYLDTSGVPFRDQLAEIHPGHPAIGAAAAEFERRKRSEHAGAALSPATIRTVRALRAAGRRVVVSSNADQDVVDDVARRCPVRFDLALGYDPARGLRKGAPHVAVVRETFRLRARDIVYVGDSLRDGELAAACGVRFVGVLGTFDRGAFARALPGAPTIQSVAELACRSSF